MLLENRKEMKRKFVDIRKIACYDNLYNDWLSCSHGDGKDRRRDIIKYGKGLKANLLRLHKELLSGTWVPDRGRTFTILTEGKWRQIHTVGVDDRIVHQAIVREFNLQQKFINRTFGSIKGRGTLRANKQVRRDIRRSGYGYAIKMDVHKYYPSVLKSKLIELLRLKYKGEKALKLAESVINSYNPDKDRGISIGALTSQNFGNFYLTSFDYFVLQDLKVKYYSRYVDDMIILCRDKAQASVWIPKLKKKAAELGLTFGKLDLFPIGKRRIDFCGYAVNRDSVKVRKGTIKRFSQKLNSLQKRPRNPIYERSCLSSYLGILKYADSYRITNILKQKYNEVFRRIDRYATRSGRSEIRTTCA